MKFFALFSTVVLREKPLAILLPAVMVMLAVGCGASKQGAGRVFDQFEESSSAQRQGKRGDDERTKQVFDHIVENLRYSRYWFGTSGIDDVYVEGKQISALIFWTKAGRQSRVGFCSSDLSCCVSTSGARLSPEITRMKITRDLTPKAAFESFVKNGIDGNTIKLVLPVEPTPALKAPPTPAPKAAQTGNAVPSIPTIPSTAAGQWFPLHTLSLTDFEFEEKSITLPPLGLPSSVLHRVVPGEAPREAKRLRQEYVCWYGNTKRPPGCTGTLVFAYYNEADPYWFVLRSCSSACPFQGDSIQFMERREDGGWTYRGAGGMNSPKDEVARFKQKIERAEMFRFKFP